MPLLTLNVLANGRKIANSKNSDSDELNFDPEDHSQKRKEFLVKIDRIKTEPNYFQGQTDQMYTKTAGNFYSPRMESARTEINFRHTEMDSARSSGKFDAICKGSYGLMGRKFTGGFFNSL